MNAFNVFVRDSPCESGSLYFEHRRAVSRRRAFLANHARRDGRPRLGSTRRCLRLRGRLCRPSVVRSFDSRALARTPRLQGGDPRTTGLEERGCLARDGRPQVVLRGQRGCDGFDDQPLHGQSEAPQCRCLFSGRGHRVSPGPGERSLRPTLPRGIQRGSGGGRGSGSFPASSVSLRLLVRQGNAQQSGVVEGRSRGLWKRRSVHSRDCDAFARWRIDSRSAEHARRGLPAGQERNIARPSMARCRL